MKHIFLKKKILAVTIVLLAVIGFTSYPLAGSVKNPRTNETFATIQAAINDTDTLDGDLLEVGTGTYYENVNVNKAFLTIIKEDNADPIVDGNGTGHTFTLTSYGITIENLTIKNSGNYYGVKIDGGYNTILENNIQDCYRGVNVNSSQNTVKENNFQDCNRGVMVNSSYNIIKENDFQGCMWSAQVNSNHNIIYKNTFSDCDRGVYLYGYQAVNNVVCDNIISGFGTGGIYLAFCSENWIYRNDITGSGNPQYGDAGINMAAASSNFIYANDIQDCHDGLYMEYSDVNKIHHNNFIDNNPYHANIYECSGNTWDTGGTTGGNYWSGVSCTDADSDLICDSAYSIPGGDGDQDGYPLVGYWSPICGNVNGDPRGDITLGDITSLVAYLVVTPGTPEPVPPCAGDVNGDGEVTESDTQYLVNYLFLDGPPPVGDCCEQLVLPWLFLNE